MTAIAGEAGYGYRWLGDRFDDSADLESALQALADEIEGLAQSGTVALICSSEDPAHRIRAAILTTPLEAHGLRVMHIRSDGAAEPHQDQLGL